MFSVNTKWNTSGSRGWNKLIHVFVISSLNRQHLSNTNKKGAHELSRTNEFALAISEELKVEKDVCSWRSTAKVPLAAPSAFQSLISH